MDSKGLPRTRHRGHSGDVAANFARLLLHLGRYEPIRTVEAIAAAIANEVDRVSSQTVPSTSFGPGDGRAREERFANYLAIHAPRFAAPDRAAEDDVAYASCLRIARRAMAAAINDPTGGAIRYHSIDEAPRWARGLLPCALIGGFIFYRDDPSLLTPQSALVR